MKNDFSYLLTALLVFLIVVPIATDLHLLSPEIIRAGGFSALLAIGLWSLRSSGRVFSAAIAFVVAGIVLSALFAYNDQIMFRLGSTLSMLAFLLLATSEAMQQIAKGNNISANRIVGAICVYLMLGIIWALSYAFLETIVPGSFKGVTEHLASTSWNPDWVYFSFVTLSTLGYGDITPVTYSARALSYFEAIVGQFYLAVLVAGLVGAYLSEKQGQGTKE